jgi:hypothetical protein
MMQARKLIGLVVVAIGTSVVAATVQAAPAQAPSAARCGGPLWRLKTLSDRDRMKVALAPHATTIGAILGRHAPTKLPTHRATPFQKQTWEVPAQITSVRRDGNELRLELFDHGGYMNAVIPAPFCLTKRTRARGDIVEAWETFLADCGPVSSDPRPLGAVFYVRGVGYWSQHDSRKGEARNGAELHPVTGLRTVAGCGS